MESEAQKTKIAENERLFRLSNYLSRISKNLLYQYPNANLDPGEVEKWFTDDVNSCRTAMEEERLNGVLNGNLYLFQVWKMTLDSLAEFQNWPSGSYNMPLQQAMEKANSFIANIFVYYFQRYRAINIKNRGLEYELMSPIDSVLLKEEEWTIIKQQFDKENSAKNDK